ncbi:MAG: ATP-binding protein [Bacteroidota bacterium]
MILKSALDQIIEAQQANLKRKNPGLERFILAELPRLQSHALIISGIRRCGKSTLMQQLMSKKAEGNLFLNFEDPRLYEFDPKEFYKLDELIQERKAERLFFDEIQLIPEWENYVRFKLDEGYDLTLTGSNASLLSKELGTKLTGRHISKELFPFSYKEFCKFKGLAYTADSLLAYLKIGGFPEYVKTEYEEILTQLLGDILVRDIAVRYGVRDVKSLQRLSLYLISNVGKLFSANRLRQLLEVNATSTVLEYLSHLEQAYLLFQIPKFSFSLRKQQINPKKLYAIDTGLVEVNSASFSDDLGRKLENLIFLHLRRTYKEIYYFSEKGECDFIVFEKGVIKEIIQVCAEINPANRDREINGLKEALNFFEVSHGSLITLRQKDHFSDDGKKIEVIPAHEFLS